MFDCPTCSDSFDSKRGLSVHHTKKHGEKIDADERTEGCPKCERSFKTERGMKMHHSREHDESISGVIVECANCGSEKREKQYKLDDYDRFFCDEKCHGEWRSENLTGKDHWSWGGETKCCGFCDEEYIVSPCEKESSSFCSRECQVSWQSENWRGENAPAWKGGYDDYYGHTWKTRRKDIQKRDGNICQLCNFDSNETLAVHHIVPVRTFDDPNNAHFDENMYQLCKECHLKMEKVNPIKQKKLLDDAEPDTLERLEEVLADEAT